MIPEILKGFLFVLIVNLLFYGSLIIVTYFVGDYFGVWTFIKTFLMEAVK